MGGCGTGGPSSAGMFEPHSLDQKAWIRTQTIRRESQLRFFECLPATLELDGTPWPNPQLRKICNHAVLRKGLGWMARGTDHVWWPNSDGGSLHMVSKNRPVLAPCGEVKTKVNWIFGQFRPFRGFGILFQQCGVFPDQGASPWQKPAFLLFQLNEKGHVLDSGFWIHRRQWGGRRWEVHGRRVPRGREMRQVRTCAEKTRIRKSGPVCPDLPKVRINKEAVRGQKIDTENGFWNSGQDECAEKSPDAKIQCFPDGTPWRNWLTVCARKWRAWGGFCWSVREDTDSGASVNKKILLCFAVLEKN